MCYINPLVFLVYDDKLSVFKDFHEDLILNTSLGDFKINTED